MGRIINKFTVRNTLDPTLKKWENLRANLINLASVIFANAEIT